MAALFESRLLVLDVDNVEGGNSYEAMVAPSIRFMTTRLLPPSPSPSSSLLLMMVAMMSPPSHPNNTAAALLLLLVFELLFEVVVPLREEAEATVR